MGDEHSNISEQGIFVYQVCECDFYAAKSLTEAQEQCAYDMGVRLSDAIRDGDIEVDTKPIDLDANTLLDTDENEKPTGSRTTYRQALKEMISDGATFPRWVWGEI